MHIIIAPHPDDDILCCSSIIYKNNNNVMIIFVTDGSKGSPRPEDWGRKLALIRINEAYNALQKLGLKNKDKIIFLNNEDGTVIKNKDKIYYQLLSIMQNNDIEAVYFPSPFDAHPDHSGISAIMLSILSNKLKNRKLNAYMYTIHKLHIPFAIYKLQFYKLFLKLKIERTWKHICFKLNHEEVLIKKQALEEHKSQIWHMPHEVKQLAINGQECFYFKQINN